jgi:hypothetical protein
MVYKTVRNWTSNLSTCPDIMFHLYYYSQKNMCTSCIVMLRIQEYLLSLVSASTYCLYFASIHNVITHCYCVFIKLTFIPCQMRLLHQSHSPKLFPVEHIFLVLNIWAIMKKRKLYSAESSVLLPLPNTNTSVNFYIQQYLWFYFQRLQWFMSVFEA